MASRGYAESKRPPRTPIGQRVETYRRQTRLSQATLAYTAGLSPTKFNDMLAGRVTKEIPIRILELIATALGNCTLEDLLDEDSPTRWGRVKKRFIHAFGHLVDKQWFFFDDNSPWPLLLPETSLRPEVLACFEVLLLEIREFQLSVDFTGISPTLEKSIIFIERAYNRRIPDTAHLLFYLCDRLVQSHSGTLPRPELKPRVDPYLAKMERVVKDTADRMLSLRLRIREADVWKICSKCDASALARADELLGSELGPISGDDRFNLEAETARNRLIVGSMTTKTDGDFDAILRTSEQLLDRGLTSKGELHVLHGRGLACAERFSRTSQDVYANMALACYERSMALMPAALSEINLRIRRLPFEYANYGMRDVIRQDGSDMKELKRLAQSAASVRVAQEIHLLEMQLKGKGIIKP